MEENEKQKFVKEDARKWRFLWISVGLVAVFLAGIWVWSFKYRLVNTNWDQTSEKQLMENLSRDWQEANDLIEKPLAEKKAAEEEVKNKLLQIATESVSASSTNDETTSSSNGESASSTENNNSTTTNQLE